MKCHSIGCRHNNNLHDISVCLSLTSVVDGVAWPLYPQERDPVPIVREAVWALAPFWTGAGNFAPHRDSMPGLSSR